MKLITILAGVVGASLALLALASTASATTLETNGVKKTEAITFEAALKSGTSLLVKDTTGTSGPFGNTCVNSTLLSKDSTATTGAAVSGPLSIGFGQCTHPFPNVDKPGTLSVEWIKGTTNGTVRWDGGEVTMPVTILGSVVTVTCKTSNTDLGTLTGTGSGGTSTIDVNAVVNCGFFVPSATWEATYVIKGHAIGVVE
jgi:hypothetical protein